MYNASIPSTIEAMKVFLCYQHIYNGCDEFANVVRVVDDEAKALVWKEEQPDTDFSWRSYCEMDVE